MVVDQRLTGGLKPGYVIPFKIEAADLPAMLTGFYQKRPLLPKNFFYNNQVGEVPTGKKESALCFLKKMVKSTVVAAAVTGAICAVAFYL